MLIDTHVHVVSDDLERFPLSPGHATNPWYETHPCSGPALRALMAEAGVDGAVLVQGVGAYQFDNSYTLAAAAEAPGVLTSVVCTDRATDDAVATVEALVRAQGARGYRWVTFAENGQLAEPRALWDALSRLSVPVVATMLADRLVEFAELVPRLPAIGLALDHCGFADLSRGVPDELAALAAFPNVFLKASTHALHSAAAGGDPADAVAELLARFDGRVMWGSDWSQTHHAPYAEIVEEGRRAAAKCSDDQRAAYSAGAALTLWPELA
ncbi:MAG: amidohydrolase family protein [Acidimicrobiia bacterium]